ncbi:uncharacterized protein P884DRAFT_70749 [Thermothelomyces heterothallicus CBS 202.75]|uniref:uncharacterized protein n=1 Tax=Thermothelomyces heterothallicus CBS 202.75 TaxID=1149848 RepID=UPI003743E05A
MSRPGTCRLEESASETRDGGRQCARGAGPPWHSRWRAKVQSARRVSSVLSDEVASGPSPSTVWARSPSRVGVPRPTRQDPPESFGPKTRAATDSASDPSVWLVLRRARSWANPGEQVAARNTRKGLVVVS